MNKSEVLQGIRALARSHSVSRDEVVAAFDEGAGVKGSVENKNGIAEILYYIGGGVVFLGIVILLRQNWETLGFATKVLVTLGAGIAAYFVGLLFGRDERTEKAGSAFYLISALVLPMGLYIVFDNAGVDAGSLVFQSVISGIMFCMYFLSFSLFKKNVFLLFSILFGTWLVFSFTSFLADGQPYFDIWKFYEYRSLMVGLSYVFLGYAFAKGKHASLTGFLYGFGILGFLGAAMSLGGWEPEQNIFWELIFPVLVFGVIFLSVYIKSKSFLTWGTIFLMAYILKITSEYFSSGLGWPLVLIIAGLAMIGVGYASFSFGKRYLA